MGDDRELLRLRNLERVAHDRYFRVKLNLSDAVAIAAAHDIWSDAVKAVRLLEDQLAEYRPPF